MIWPPDTDRPTIVEWQPDTSRTGGGGWAIDSNGTRWRIVDQFGPRGTGDREATIVNGRVHER
jgi:hypothetical protein